MISTRRRLIVASIVGLVGIGMLGACSGNTESDAPATEREAAPEVAFDDSVELGLPTEYPEPARAGRAVGRR